MMCYKNSNIVDAAPENTRRVIVFKIKRKTIGNLKYIDVW
jgi:hypothetical protein